MFIYFFFTSYYKLTDQEQLLNGTREMDTNDIKLYYNTDLQLSL